MLIYGIISYKNLAKNKLGKVKYMLKFLPNHKAPKNTQEREMIDTADNERLDQWQKKFQQEMKKLTNIPHIRNFKAELTYPISQKFSEYSKLPYGKIGTIADAGCGPLAVEYALRVLGYPYTFKEVLNVCVKNGYRAYVFDENGNIVDGAGSEYSLFDNNATTIQEVQDIFKYLQKGYPITLLVNNAIYHNDENRKGNHFVTLIGIDENQNLIIMDGNLITNSNEPETALIKKNFRKMASGIRCAWAWRT